MVVSCFALIAGICLAPTSSEVSLRHTTIARSAVASYENTSLQVSESKDNILNYEWPSSSSIEGGVVRYWKYVDRDRGKIRYTISTKDNSNVTVEIDDTDRAKSILADTYVVSEGRTISFAQLTLARDSLQPPVKPSRPR